MSYHILHQFDETWLDEITRPDLSVQEAQLSEALNMRRKRRMQNRLVDRLRFRELIVIAATIVVALASLLYSVHTSRKMAELQQRLQLIESRIGDRNQR
jgi:cell division protein FtsL